MHLPSERTCPSPKKSSKPKTEVSPQPWGLQGSRNRLAEPQTKPGWSRSLTAQDNQGDGHFIPWFDLPLTPDKGAHWELVPTVQFCTAPQQKSHQARKTHLPASTAHCPGSQPLKSEQERFGGSPGIPVVRRKIRKAVFSRTDRLCPFPGKPLGPAVLLPLSDDEQVQQRR